MNNYEKITEFHFTLNRETVFQLIDLYPGNSVYEDILEEYEDIEAEALQHIKPMAFYKYSSISEETVKHHEGKLAENAPVIYVLVSIGNEIVDLSNRYFDQGDYLLGMLINAIADAYLFQMEDSIKDLIKESTIARQMGISQRMDAPIDMPMIVQKDILEEIKKDEDIAIDVTEGYMYTTVKTLGYLLVLTKDEEAVYVGHTCSKCSAKNCKLRKEPGPA